MNESKPARRGLGGQLLVAQPDLLDPNFRQSIVFLARHNNREGSLGFVMNRPLQHTLGDVALSKSHLDALKDLPVFWGGPVQGDRITLVLFRLAETTDAVRCTIGESPERIAANLGKPGAWIRAFAGCAGWSSGQLKQELDDASWRVTAPHVALFDDRLLPGLWPLLASGDERWRRLVSRLPRADDLN